MTNILFIDESVQQQAQVIKLVGMMPKGVNIDQVFGIDVMDDVIKTSKRVHNIIVLGTNYTDTDVAIRRKLHLIRISAPIGAKLVLYVAKAPEDPVSLNVNHIVRKPNIGDLAAALRGIIPYVHAGQDEEKGVEA